jgi:hypothetical protein
VLGPDNAWQRLQEILKWFDEVQAVGGYRKYYDGKREGTQQGGGTAGGLGLDHEFFESVLVPQVMLYGFLGFAPRAEGFKLDPRLPSDWPELSVDRVRFQNLTLRLRATRDSIEIHKDGLAAVPTQIQLPEGKWKCVWLGADGSVLKAASPFERGTDGTTRVDWSGAAAVRFERPTAGARQP